MTTAQKTDLDALIERVKGAKDNEQSLFIAVTSAILGDVDAAFPRILRFIDVEAYESAAVALAERCLPGWHIERLSDDISPSGEVVGASVLLENFLGCYGKMGSGKTRALALLAAILTAFKAQETK